MGFMHAVEYAAMRGTRKGREIGMRVHLTSNHYPPLPESLVAVALRVVQRVNRGEWDQKILLPEGTTWRGQSRAPLSECVEAWHLRSFLDGDNE